MIVLTLLVLSCALSEAFLLTFLWALAKEDPIVSRVGLAAAHANQSAKVAEVLNDESESYLYDV